jgi:hypothetical protein
MRSCGCASPSVPRQVIWYLVALVTHSLAHERGDVSDLVEPGAPETLFELSNIDDEDLRYFDLVEPAYGERFTSSSSRLVLAGRGGYGAMDPSDETWNIAIVESGPHNRASPESKVVVYDRGFSSNGFMRKFGSMYYAFGGEYIDDAETEWQPNDPRDGIHVIRGSDLDAIRNGAWLHPEHGYGHDAGSKSDVVSKHQFAVDGWHPGHRDARGGTDNIMMFDGKVSVAHKDGHWLLYARANLAFHGGRHVVVAKSRTGEPWGADAYEDFRLISIAGYDDNGPGNVYFAGIDRHPLDEDMLVGLFPINLGEPGRHDGDGESFIGMALSCDGIHFSEFTPLVWTNGREGRTWDHPVDGMMLLDDGRVSFMIHSHVKGISPEAPRDSKIMKYQLKTDAFLTLSRNAKRSLQGCSFPPRPPPSPAPSPPPSPFPMPSPPPDPQTPPPPPSSSPHASNVLDGHAPDYISPSSPTMLAPSTAAGKPGESLVLPVMTTSMVMLMLFGVYKLSQLKGKLMNIRGIRGMSRLSGFEHSTPELDVEDQSRRRPSTFRRRNGSPAEQAKLQGAGVQVEQEDWNELNEAAQHANNARSAKSSREGQRPREPEREEWDDGQSARSAAARRTSSLD